MNVITVKINGVEYNLKGEEKEEYLHKVANYIDKKIKNIMETNDKLSTASAAVLTAINSADEMFKCDEAYQKLQDKVNQFTQSEKNLKHEIEILKEELRRVQEVNNELKDKLNNVCDANILKEKEEIIKKITEELDSMNKTAKKCLDDKNVLVLENKELKFQLQTSKYKIINLQNKLIDNQIDLAKAKKNLSNPPVNIEL